MPDDGINRSQVLGQAHGMIERQQADVGRKPDALGAGGHGPSHGNPGRQVAVVNKVVLRKPYQVEPELLQSDDLIEHFSIQPGGIDAGVRRIAKIVDHPSAKG